jgi:hypothetical protein
LKLFVIIFRSSIERDVEAGPVEWLEPVADEEYNK